MRELTDMELDAVMRELTDMELDAVSGGHGNIQIDVNILTTGSFNVNTVQQSNTSSIC